MSFYLPFCLCHSTVSMLDYIEKLSKHDHPIFLKYFTYNHSWLVQNRRERDSIYFPWREIIISLILGYEWWNSPPTRNHNFFLFCFHSMNYCHCLIHYKTPSELRKTGWGKVEAAEISPLHPWSFSLAWFSLKKKKSNFFFSFLHGTNYLGLLICYFFLSENRVGVTPKIYLFPIPNFIHVPTTTFFFSFFFPSDSYFLWWKFWIFQTPWFQNFLFSPPHPKF